ncbi:wax ester/triacylglycerol synthase family O-acyltransferase [Streptomyces sp. NPDC001691]|uniref:wax ester/triacylglycerol synthase family O-acyltransferase n=1 Tax=unclassified Streptomyces TaxID=2593676 RepID=UPI000DEB0F61|nr:wax ester/triacylglycerol synthase family O-acyltransferase [Streptomyces sp. SDr-06]RCH65646.1 wax ester/triacylglycerol synthase family O-acyltransferase [Streptomyces sp. SDr-06]
MSSELLAPLDLAFWHLESAEHPMHLGALAHFEPLPGTDGGQILELLARRAAAIPRLRMCVRGVWLPVGGAAWVADKDFDVRRHVRRVPLPAGDFHAEAARTAGELMERPLERGLPPWRMYVLTSEEDRAFAVLVKLHHALADGMRAVAIGAGILDQLAGPSTRRRRPVPPRSWLPGPRQVAGFARDRVNELTRAVGIGASVMRASRLELGAGSALAADSSGTRRLATAVLDHDDVQRVRRAEGGTANDVLLAVVAGGLRRWLLERDSALPGAQPRALVPVSRRRPGAPPGSGNKLSAYLLGLPVAEPDPLARLALVRTAMDRNKAAGPGRGAGAVALLADQLPPLAHRFGAPLAGNAARLLFDLLVTSVPLPRSQLSLGGCPLRAIYPMAPLARGQSLAIALSTYGGRVHIGLVADGKAVPDLDRLAACFGQDLAELLKASAAR